MKKAIYFTLFLVLAIVIHDTVYAEQNNIPFKLTDFGWLIQQYLPGFEDFLIEKLSQDFRSKYLGPLFQTKALYIALTLGIFLIFMNAFHYMRVGKSITAEIPLISLFFRKNSSSAKSYKHQRSKGRFKYKSRD